MIFVYILAFLMYLWFAFVLIYIPLMERFENERKKKMIKCEVIGFKKLNSSNGDFYNIYAVSKEPISNGSGYLAYSEFVDVSHLRKHNITEDTLIGRECQHYTVKDGNRWKSGLTFK